MASLARWVPIVGALRGYRGAWFRADLIAGISVCVVMIPSVLAYAELAGLPPQQGLYAPLAGMIGYALFASSRQVIVGPDAALTLLLAGAIGPLVAGDVSRAVSLAALVALLGGTILLLAAVCRIGVIAELFSKSVLVGYMSGAALIIASTQLGKLFGIKLDAREFFPTLRELFGRLGETHWLTLLLGFGFIAILEVLRRISPKAPGALIVCVLAVGVSLAFDLASRGVMVIGEVKRGLPQLGWPAPSLNDVRTLLPGALAIALLTFPEAILIARAFSAKNRYEIKANQELVALAAANFAAGLFQGFSVGASQSRTVINDASGGKTQVVSLIASALLIAFLLALTPILEPLPTVALAAILVSAGIHLVEVHAYRRFFRISPGAGWLALIVALGVLIVGVIPGILVGVGLSLGYLLARLARPTDAVLQEVPGTGGFHDVGAGVQTHTVPGLIAYRFYAPLTFANAEHFARRIRSLVAESPQPVKWVLVDVQAMTEIDVNGTEVVQQLVEELAAQGVALKFARANRPLRAAVERIGLSEKISQEWLFPSVHAAVEAFRRQESAGEDAARSEP
ncbi:MAG TPA: sulfate permease [Planctomycetota bacterium]|nr:sulfate permease [Planctomycetota bacterium]